MTLTRRGLFGSVVALLGARFARKIAPAPAMTSDRLYSGFMAKSWSNRPSTYKQACEAFENSKAGYASQWKAGVVTVGLTGDFSTMRAALDAVPDGGVVLLMPGHYERINGDWTAVRSRPLWRSSDPRFDLDA